MKLVPLSDRVVLKQLEMLRMRNTCPVFSEDAEISSELNGSAMKITWKNEQGCASLDLDFEKETYQIDIREN